MKPLRVLIVDDSVVFRVVTRKVLSEEPDIEVVGMANNGRVGIEKIKQLLPDLVLLDVEMPEMNGLDALVEIRNQWPRLPVIICSSLTQTGASTVVEALFRGANECLAKPSSLDGDASGLVESFRSELLARVRAVSARSAGGGASRAAAATAAGVVSPHASPSAAGASSPQSLQSATGAANPSPPGGTSPLQALRELQQSAAAGPVRQAPRGLSAVRLVVIGTSTGGPSALKELLSALPAHFAVPVLVVQHMPALFTRMMSSRLNERCALHVAEAQEGQLVKAGEVLIAPGDFHMGLRLSNEEVVIGLSKEPPEHSCRPAVDYLFRSASACYGAGVLAVVLTGMGRDGALGCAAVRQAGGKVIIQDEATSVVWGMPGAVNACGQFDKMMPLGDIAAELVDRVQRSTGAGVGWKLSSRTAGPGRDPHLSQNRSRGPIHQG